MTQLTPGRLAVRQKQIAKAVAEATPEERRQAARDRQKFEHGPDGWYLFPGIDPAEVDYMEEALAALSSHDGYDCIIAISRTNAGSFLVHFKTRSALHPFTVDDIAPTLAFLESPDLIRVTFPSLGYGFEPGTAPA